MNSFKDHYRKFNKKTGEAVKRRHVDSMFANAAVRPVPKAHRTDNNIIAEFESLKRKEKGTPPATINLAKARKLQAQFNLKEPRGMLGNTGIFLAPHHESGFFTLTK